MERRHLIIVVTLVMGLGLGLCLRQLVEEVKATTDFAAERVPAQVKQGDRIVIPDGSPLRKKLMIDTVGEKTIQRTLSLPAVVEADPSRLVKILPPVSGRVVQLKVQLGERVEQGQPLAVLDSAELSAAYTDNDRAHLQLKFALADRDRQRGLAKIGGAAEKDLQQAEMDYLSAEAEADRTEAHLRQIGAPLEMSSKSRVLTITSPIAGSVIELTAAPGAFWNDTNAALMTVADLSTIWVAANVPEKDVVLVAKGQVADVVFSAYPGEEFRGHVLFVSDVLEPDTRRAQGSHRFPEPGPAPEAGNVRQCRLSRRGATGSGYSSHGAASEERD